MRLFFNWSNRFLLLPCKKVMAVPECPALFCFLLPCMDGSAAVWHSGHFFYIRRHLRMAPHWLSIFCLKKKKKKSSTILLFKVLPNLLHLFSFSLFSTPTFFFPPLWSWRPPCKPTWHHERELNVLERPLLFWWELLCNCKVPIKAQVVS